MIEGGKQREQQNRSNAQEKLLECRGTSRAQEVHTPGHIARSQLSIWLKKVRASVNFTCLCPQKRCISHVMCECRYQHGVCELALQTDKDEMRGSGLSEFSEPLE